MDNVSYDETIKTLRERVNRVTKTSDPVHSAGNNVPSIFGKLKSNMIYIAVPFGIFVMLLILRPGFITYEIKEDDKVVKKLSFTKLIITTAILTLVVVVAIYAYRKSKSSSA